MDRARLRAYGVSALSFAALVTIAGPAAAVQNVLVAHAEGTAAWVTDVQSKIASTGLISRGVDTYDLTSGTPTPDYLRQYAAVLMFSDSPLLDASALGDALASYVDCGGGVVLATFAHYGGDYSPEGSWASGGYTPIQFLSTASGTPLTLGAIFNPAHPVLAGVSSLNGGTA